MVCLARYQRELYVRKIKKPRKFTQNEKDIFKLGVLKGQDRCNDLEKTITVLQTTIKHMVEVIKQADQRDACRPETPE